MLLHEMPPNRKCDEPTIVLTYQISATITGSAAPGPLGPPGARPSPLPEREKGFGKDAPPGGGCVFSESENAFGDSENAFRDSRNTF